MIGTMMLAAVAVSPVAAQAPRAQIEAAMRDSATGWNQGNLARFMAIYADAPGTTYVTTRGLVRGKAAIAAQYRPRFTGPIARQRGHLSFSTLDFRMLDARHALYIGRYVLDATGGGRNASGPTSLVFERGAAGWHIIADHSS